jgi:hypothetical protein
MVERCPRCGLLFEREEGQWVGAMIVNFVVTEAAFVVVLVGGLLLTWPDVPWVGLTVVAVAVNLAVPLIFYPTSKTVWVGIDLLMHGGDRASGSIGRAGFEAGDAGRPGPEGSYHRSGD